MDEKVLLAWIAGIASLVVASVGLITAILTGRQSAKATASFELLKRRLDHGAGVAKLEEDEFQKNMERLAEALTLTQRLKNELQLILSSVDSSLTSKTAETRLTEAHDNLLKSFENAEPYLIDEEREAYHRIKGIAVGIGHLVHNDVASKAFASEITLQTRNALTLFREELTDLQNSLRDSRISRIAQRTLVIHRDPLQQVP